MSVLGIFYLYLILVFLPQSDLFLPTQFRCVDLPDKAQHSQQSPTLLAGFEAAITALERPQIKQSH
jgi:hypothetical protein